MAWGVVWRIRSRVIVLLCAFIKSHEPPSVGLERVYEGI